MTTKKAPSQPKLPSQKVLYARHLAALETYVEVERRKMIAAEQIAAALARLEQLQAAAAQGTSGSPAS